MNFDFLSLLTVVVASAAPFITEVTKSAVSKVGGSVPKKLKPVLNVALAAILGALCGDAQTGAAVGVATSAAFAVGKKS